MKRTLVMLALVCGSLAQAQDAKPSREREALRRAQAALRAAQSQQSQLQADKAEAEAAAIAAREDGAKRRAEADRLGALLRAREAELAQLKTQLQTTQAAREQSEQRAAASQEDLLRQLQAARLEAGERQQANQALSRLLERSNIALGDAEAKNRQLHAWGLELVERYRGRSRVDEALLQDPILGLTAIRFEDQAEKLRAELAALRVRQP